MTSARAFRPVAITLVLLVALLLTLSFLLDEPMRRAVESKMNRALTGYTASVGKLDFNPFALSVTLRDVVVRQESHSDPAVLVLPRLKASVHWREVLALRLVADVVFDRPRVYMNLIQLREETRDAVPMEKRGWQDALQAIYPLKFNLLQIAEGDFTYIDTDPSKPLQLRQVNLKANNIRNIHSPERVYPSPVQAEAIVFESGRASVSGNANFLAEPLPAVQLRFDIRNVPLDRLRTVAARSDLTLRGGVLATTGLLEYSPTLRKAHLDELTIRKLRVDYSAKGSDGPKAGKSRASRDAKAPRLDLRLGRLRLLQSELGLRHEERGYRVFLDSADLDVTNLSNLRFETPAVAKLEGRFMGSGRTRADATFRPSDAGPDVFLKLSIQGTQLAKMNDILRSHGSFDVTRGTFSLYSEVRVRKGVVDGYVKPLFQDVEAYDRRQDAKKGFFRKVYESVVELVAEILENQQRDEVASVVRLSGRIENPDSNVFQIIGSLIQNAFFKAILPGFERQAEGVAKKEPKKESKKD